MPILSGAEQAGLTDKPIPLILTVSLPNMSAPWPRAGYTEAILTVCPLNFHWTARQPHMNGHQLKACLIA